MIPLTDRKIIYNEKQKLCHICKKGFFCDKNEKNLEIIAIIQENLEALPIAFVI